MQNKFCENFGEICIYFSEYYINNHRNDRKICNNFANAWKLQKNFNKTFAKILWKSHIIMKKFTRILFKKLTENSTITELLKKF